MNNPKYFQLNGKKYFTNDDISLLDLIHYFNYNSSLLVLEYNNFICNKTNWQNIILKNNDTVEIVTIVGGG
jgi:sulfur carrier protein